ncbi:MAG: D-glycero-beta-D-manno-heptose 1-phosphate adenylyltransferase [Bacteroidales bacterium]|nr:D-glycero-beta-D-manno-heptose 1-phosphate adenylyltransferase [Bacteroidales bacterium]MBN2698538.1 D-glycero-beta-D-manno-heptose 1-phosphate adenylyltransferase [Bacteroidales bacterium]
MREHLLKKIVSTVQITGILNPGYRKLHTVAFTNGCFDILHRGHIYYLSKIREKADILIIGLNSDNSVHRLKGPGRPVQDQQTRAEILASLFFVDFVILFAEETPIRLITLIRPDLLVKGGDYRAEDIVGYEEVTSYGGRVETIPFLEGYSSSDLIKRIK